MRQVLEASATALIIAGITGDIASTTSLAASAPMVLLQTKYSRDYEREADRYAVEMMRKAGLQPRYFASMLARLEADSPGSAAFPTFLSSHPATEERQALALAAGGNAAQEADIEDADELVPERSKLIAVDPAQRQVLALLRERHYVDLERLLGSLQLGFEQDEASSPKLENAFAAFRKLERSGEAVLNEWVTTSPSYTALLSRGNFYLSQGLDARGTAYYRDTPEENIRTMQFFLAKAERDFERSLALTPKPYLSRLGLMSIARQTSKRHVEKAHYAEALKLAPQSVELRLAYMTGLEPRWGGSYAEMAGYAAQARADLKDARAADRLAARIPAYQAFERQSANDYAGALKHYNEAIALDPAAGFLCERSWVLSKLERDAEALADVKLALSKARDHRYCLQRAVAVARKIGDVGEAIRLLDLVIEVDPNSMKAFTERGWKYQQTGHLDIAFQDYLAAAKLGDSWAQMQVGKFYFNGWDIPQDREEGLMWLRKAAEHGDRDAKLSLQQALELHEKFKQLHRTR
jgi:predicted Zn-dependent protease